MTHTTDAAVQWIGPTPRTKAESLRRNLIAAATCADLWEGAFTVNATEYGVDVQGSGAGCLSAARAYFGLTDAAPSRTHVAAGYRFTTWQIALDDWCIVSLIESVVIAEADK